MKPQGAFPIRSSSPSTSTSASASASSNSASSTKFPAFGSFPSFGSFSSFPTSSTEPNPTVFSGGGDGTQADDYSVSTKVASFKASSFPSWLVKDPEEDSSVKGRSSKEKSSRERSSRNNRSDDSDREDRSSRSHKKKDKKKHKRDGRDRSPRSRSRSRDRRRSRSRGREREGRRRSKSPSSSSSSKSRIVPKVEVSKVFFSDRKGDADNMVYGSLYAMDVPKYKRFGGGLCIGLPPTFFIDVSTKPGPVKKPNSRYMMGKQYWKDLDKESVTFRTKNTQPQSSTADFIILDPNNPRKEEPKHFDLFAPDDDDDDSSSSSDSDIGEDLRKEREKVKVMKQEEKDQEAREGGTQEDIFTKRVAALNQEIRASPKNLALWKDLLSLQDHSIRHLTGEKERNQRGLVEKKISIIERALTELPDNEELISEYLHLCEHTWEAARILNHWEVVLKKKPQSFPLWMQYLKFRQSNNLSFEYQGCSLAFSRALTSIGSPKRLVGISAEEKERQQLLIFEQACLFHLQAGYTEKAFACFQALIELNLCCPGSLHSRPLPLKVAQLRLFWESSVPRFGEKGSLGWAEFYQSRKPTDITPAEPKSLEAQEIAIASNETSNSSTYAKWAEIESLRERANWLSFNSGGAIETPEDPDRIVMFDDFEEFLFDITTKEVQAELLSVFLRFLGIPFRSTNSETLSRSQGLFEGWRRVDMKAMMAKSASGLPDFPFPSFPISPDTLFISPQKASSWFSLSPALSSLDRDQGYQDFVSNVLEQGAQHFPEKSAFLVTLLAFEKRYDQKKAQKTAKRLLKQQKTDLYLWNGYAQLEKASGNLAECRKVYFTALTLSAEFPAEDAVARPLLFRLFAELELEQMHRDKSLAVYVSMADGKFMENVDFLSEQDPTTTVSPSRLLKTKNKFEVMLVEHKAELPRYKDILIDEILCYIAFLYLTGGMEAAQKAFTQNFSWIKAKMSGTDAELYYTSFMKIAHLHTLYVPSTPPRFLRELSLTGLKDFPSNTTLLCLLMISERGNVLKRGFDGYLESMAHDPPVSIILFLVFMHLHDGSSNSARSVLSDAVESRQCKVSPLIWSLFLQLEISDGRYQSAKAVLYRALAACPWSKDIILDSFKFLGSVMSEEENQMILGLLEEKGLRARTLIEEIELLKEDKLENEAEGL